MPAGRNPRLLIHSLGCGRRRRRQEVSAAPLTSVQQWRLWRGPPELAILGSGGPPPPELAGQVVPPLKTAPDEESRDDFEEKEAAKIEAR